MATTPELHQPQIAAARAQAWHQDWQEVTPQATPQTGITAETSSEAPSSDQTAAPGELDAKNQPPVKSADEAELESDGASESEDKIDADDHAESESDDELDSDFEEEEDDDSEVDDESDEDLDSDEDDLDSDDPSDDDDDDDDHDDDSESAPAAPETLSRAATPSVPVSSTGSRILTLEAAREFVNSCGLLLFGPRSLGAPAPSLVEATLGAAKTSVTSAESEIARSLVARLVAEGSAVPLNLLGGPGDIPDFVVSTAAFPFVFTLRGDKGWKRAPETSGAVKVTTLALHVYEVLTEKGALTVAEIVTEVGREITESAVVRALSELWALLRVLPSLQQGEGATRWELTTARFIKAVKAGANAGQPTALSALISLYLGQAFLATEDEISAYLSPLTARSRVRDVLHGLSAGRQLSEAVLEGKTVLFLPDSLPDFAADQAAPASPGASGADQPGVEGNASTERIRRFEGGAEAGRDRSFRGKPVARPDSSRPGSPRPDSRFGGGAGRGPRPSRPAPRGDDRPARPFSDRSERGDRPDRFARPDRPAPGGSPRDGAGDRPSFSRPWDEEKRDRPARPGGDRPARPAFGARPSFGDRDSRPPRREGGSDRPSFGNRDRPSSGDRPSFGDRSRPSFGDRDRPSPRREGPSGGAPPFRRREEGSGESRPFRSSFSPESGAGDRGPREPRGEGRPPRREGASGGFFPRRENRDGGNDRPRPFRPAGDRPSGSFAPRKSFDRPSREGGPGAGRSFGGGGGFRPRDEATGAPSRSGRPSNDRPAFRDNGSSRPFSDRPARPFGDRPARPFNDRPNREGEAPRNRPSGNFADRGGFKRAPGGFSRGPGGPNRGSGNAGRGAGGFSRGPARGPQGDRPAARPRPEDEA